MTRAELRLWADEQAKHLEAFDARYETRAKMIAEALCSARIQGRDDAAEALGRVWDTQSAMAAIEQSVAEIRALYTDPEAPSNG